MLKQMYAFFKKSPDSHIDWEFSNLVKSSLVPVCRDCFGRCFVYRSSGKDDVMPELCDCQINKK